MAGKHVAATSATALNTLTNRPFNIVLARAYAEGRRSFPAANPHPSGTPAFTVWAAGFASIGNSSLKFETQS